MRAGSVLALAVVAAALLGGCGGERRGAVAAAAARTADERTARVQTMTVIRYDDGLVGRMFGRGVVDYDAGTSSFLFRTEADDAPAFGGDYTMVRVGNVLYLDLRGLGWTRAKPWIRYDMRDLERRYEQGTHDDERTTTLAGGDDAVELSDTSDVAPTFGAERDPLRLLEYLRESDGTTERVGEDAIRGISMTHYRTTLDLRQAIASDLEALAWSERAVDNALRRVPATQLRVDAWVDSDGRVRRLRTRYRGEIGRNEHTTTETTEFLEFGIPVRVARPPAHLVTDWDDVFVATR